MSPYLSDIRLLVTFGFKLFISLSPISLSCPVHVDNAPPIDRWPIVFVKLNKPSTACTCTVEYQTPLKPFY